MPQDKRRKNLEAIASPGVIARFTRSYKEMDMGYTTKCWVWQGLIDRDGYGRFSVRDWYSTGSQVAHRVSWRIHVGAIEHKMVLDHLCRVRTCCNYSHLESVTLAENTKRGEHPNIVTHYTKICKRGHDLSIEENIRHLANGGISCKVCAKMLRKERGTVA